MLIGIATVRSIASASARSALHEPQQPAQARVATPLRSRCRRVGKPCEQSLEAFSSGARLVPGPGCVRVADDKRVDLPFQQDVHVYALKRSSSWQACQRNLRLRSTASCDLVHDIRRDLNPTVRIYQCLVYRGSRRLDVVDRKVAATSQMNPSAPTGPTLCALLQLAFKRSRDAGAPAAALAAQRANAWRSS